MKNSKALFQDFVQQITLPADRDEVQSIAQEIFSHVFGLSRTDFLGEKKISVTDEQEGKLSRILKRVNSGEPVQYILGEAFFFTRAFHVTPDVLIPRPETEELVRAILATTETSGLPLRVLDIGTGSGCIPITIKCERPSFHVFAIDISEAALDVARENAHRLHADVSFLKQDVLGSRDLLDNLDIIVSNPPYIAASEANVMTRNVIDFEPHLALFVPDDDPLLFYHAIALKAKGALRRSGMLWFEINERFAREVKVLLEENGFLSVEIIQDISGKDRIIRANI